MGGETEALVAHCVLGCVALNSMRKVSDASFVHPGMHINCLIHAILGAIDAAGSGGSLGDALKISKTATKCLPLPFMMADMYYGYSNNADLMRGIHILSGVVPFAMNVMGKPNKELEQICIGLNLLSVAYYTFDRSSRERKKWGCGLIAASVAAYFVFYEHANTKMLYPLCLAAMEFCSQSYQFGWYW